MLGKREHELIVKYLTNTITFPEIEELENWLDKGGNKEEFLNYIRTNYTINYNLSNFDIDKAEKNLREIIENEKGRKKIFGISRVKRVMKYAAILVLVSTTSYFLLSKANDSEPILDGNEVVVETGIVPGSNKAILELDDGSEINLGKSSHVLTNNAKSNGKEIIYKNKLATAHKLEYNTLTIPRGGQYFIELSDGTRVWMNSDSKLKYPVSFIDGQSREVELVYGEAYFDVSPSTKHNGAEFKVFNEGQEIRVLGTEFNIKSYKEEAHIYTTLVEGKVLVKYDDIKQELLPEQQSNVNLSSKHLMVKTVDLYNEISWKEGVFSFEKKPLKEVMTVLSRWFDMDVTFKNKEIETILFDGVLGKEQKIDEILAVVKDFGIINDYQIIDKQVVLE
ncbi:FecR family protein [Seonamhaeicola sp.]|uniref:FecR family protein n=1 Tax=Seonamhaeicola sp. TaxID=1912245 RepID=UPI00262573C5|nr:FecR family protein [Seonamhaeicola sp.]